MISPGGCSTPIVGGLVYPLPPATTLTAVTIPLVICDVATTAVPPPPVKLIVGTEVYPLPFEVISIAITAPPLITAVAVAPLPPPPVILTNGTEEY